jgi:hypothetical protein
VSMSSIVLCFKNNEISKTTQVIPYALAMIYLLPKLSLKLLFALVVIIAICRSIRNTTKKDIE